MQSNENNIEQMRERASGSVAQCAEGHEILPPVELMAYLRLTERGGELPPTVHHHIQGCRVCSGNWELIRDTDDELKKFRRERVQMIIGTVLAEADISELPMPEDTSRTPLSPSEVRYSIEGIKARLSAEEAVLMNDPLVAEVQKQVNEVPSATPLPVSNSIADIPSKIRAIRDDKKREQAIGSIAAIFRTRIEEYLRTQIEKSVSEKDESSDVALYEFMKASMDPKTKMVDLSSVKIPMDVAVTCVATCEATLRNPGVLEKSDDTILLNAELFQRLRSGPPASGADAGRSRE